MCVEVRFLPGRGDKDEKRPKGVPDRPQDKPKGKQGPGGGSAKGKDDK